MKFKAGDTVKCINTGGNNLTLNEKYVVVYASPEDNTITLLNDKGTKTGYFDHRFELVTPTEDLHFHIKRAQSFIGKAFQYEGQRINRDDFRVKVYLDEADFDAKNGSMNARGMFAKLGYAVVLRSGNLEYDIMKVKELPQHKEIKLNGEYTAQVFADKVVVGCQTISKDALKEVYEAMLELSGN